MESKKINQLATELAPELSDLTIIGDPTTGISKKITLSQMASLFTGTVEEYANLASFPLVGTADTIYIALDTNIIYRWNTGTSAYVELSPNIVTSLVFNDANGFDGTISLVGSTATLTITTALTQGSVPFIGASGALSQDNANLFFDDTNNRLGINTNTPTTALDVFGSGIIGRLNGTSTNNAFLGFASAGSNKWSIGNVQSDHRFRIYNEATTSELVSVLQTGEFGIGIANPTTKLHIDGGASALIANLDANVSVAKSISFRSDNSNRFNIEVSGTESGSNAGANFFIRRYSDAGALIDTPLTITRSTGAISLATALNGTSATFSGDLTLDNGLADGAQLVLASSGFSNWNIDNFSGSLRAYYGATVGFSIASNLAATFNGSVTLSSSAPTLNLTSTNVNGINEIYFNRNTNTLIGYMAVGVNSTITGSGNEFIIDNRISGGSLIFRTNNGGTSASRLTIASTGTLSLLANNANTSEYNYLVFDNTAIGYGDWNIYKTNANNLGIGYGTTAGSSYSNAMTFMYGGFVGIATGSADQRLTINQGASGTNQGVPATSGSTQNGILRLRPAIGVFGETLDFGMNVGPTYGWIQSTNASGLNTNYALALNPNGGNVLIGTKTDNGFNFVGSSNGHSFLGNTMQISADDYGGTERQSAIGIAEWANQTNPVINLASIFPRITMSSRALGVLVQVTTNSSSSDMCSALVLFARSSNGTWSAQTLGNIQIGGLVLTGRSGSGTSITLNFSQANFGSATITIMNRA